MADDRGSSGEVSLRPRVFDPDTGEVLAASEGVEPKAPAAPRKSKRPGGRTVLVVLISLAVGIVAGLASGVSWQRHQDSLQRADAVSLTVRLGSSSSPEEVEGTKTPIQLEVDNHGPRPVTLTSVTLRTGSISGHVTSDGIIRPAGEFLLDVPMPLPCDGVGPESFDATLDVRTTSGHVHLVPVGVQFGGISLTPTCADGAITGGPQPPSGSVVLVRPSPHGFDVTLQVSLPDTDQPSEVSVTAVPLTPDPSSETPLLPGKSTHITVSLTPANACGNDISSIGVPTAFEVSAVDEDGTDENSNGDTIPMPPDLVHKLIHALDVGCPS